MKKSNLVIGFIIYCLCVTYLFSTAYIIRDLHEANRRIYERLEVLESDLESNRLVYERLEALESDLDEAVQKLEGLNKAAETDSQCETTTSSTVSYDSIIVETMKPVEEHRVTTNTQYFDVPLSDDLQDYIFNVCESYNVDPAIIVAMIKKESTYRADAMGDSGKAYGLMQIQPRWHQARMDRLGVANLLDPYQNVLVGIDYLAELIGHGQGLNWSLMAYNGGISYANKKAAAGVVSDYARIVVATAEELRN